MSPDGVVTERRLFNPFPGLRPFEMHESHLFFGRDGQSDQIIRRLARTRFVGVVGTSGSGKSSLVRAGLLPALHGGFMTGAGSAWRIALFRPGNNPIRTLASALIRPDVFGSKEQDEDVATAVLEATLRRSALGLVEATRIAGMEPNENLLVVVDQFEELFRFTEARKDSSTWDEAAAFVKLLLEAAKRKEGLIYVVLTMRSDYLGDCAQFRDLPEALNDGQYLIPRMSRDQRRQAIEGPVAVGGGGIAPRLVQRLLNEIGDDPDQLPVLQHALMRTWQHWENRRDDSLIDLRHYEEIGTLQNAVNLHAQEAYISLTESQQKIAEKLFKCLTEIDAGNRIFRRATRLGHICAVAEAAQHDVIEVVDRFRTDSHWFLMPPGGEELTGDLFIDISHESLIRQWETLRGWVEREANSRKQYYRIVDAAYAELDRKGGLWRDPELKFALDWLSAVKPNQAWANLQWLRSSKPDQPLADQFYLAIAFLERSKKAQNRHTRLQIAGAVGFGLLILAVLGLWLYFQHQQTRQAEEQARLKEAIAAQAQETAKLAEAGRAGEEELRRLAEQRVKELEQIKQELEAAKMRAETNAVPAQVKKRRVDENRQ
jgi:hypothetical protein